jgi:hypothetical protein
MIEIITGNIEMPEYSKRRYQYHSLDLNGRKWQVIDTENNSVVYKGKYEGAAIACHNLNKKYYRDEKVLV